MVDIPWGKMDGPKWPIGGPPMHDALGSLARRIGQIGHVVDLLWRQWLDLNS